MQHSEDKIPAEPQKTCVSAGLKLSSCAMPNAAR